MLGRNPCLWLQWYYLRPPDVHCAVACLSVGTTDNNAYVSKQLLTICVSGIYIWLYSICHCKGMCRSPAFDIDALITPGLPAACSWPAQPFHPMRSPDCATASAARSHTASHDPDCRLQTAPHMVFHRSPSCCGHEPVCGCWGACRAQEAAVAKQSKQLDNNKNTVQQQRDRPAIKA